MVVQSVNCDTPVADLCVFHLILLTACPIDVMYGLEQSVVGRLSELEATKTKLAAEVNTLRGTQVSETNT
jgi:hypothetical protein